MRPDTAANVPPFRILVRHFLRQLLSFESVSTGGEAKQVVIAVVSLLAAPGYYVAVWAVRGSTRTAMVNTGLVAPSLWLWSREWLLFAVSLVAVAVLVAVEWRSFVLGGRDYRILGALPLRRRTVMSAKLASLGAAVLLLHLGVNALSGLVLPMASPFGWARAAIALQLALLLQTAFVACAIVAAQGLVSFALPVGAARRAAPLLQAGILLAAALLLVSEGAISRLAYHTRDGGHLVNVVVPVVWFRALYVRLLGVDSVHLAAQARFALIATAASVAAVIPCCLLGYRDTEAGRIVQGRRDGLGSSRICGLLGGRAVPPVARAVSSFVSAAVRRSAGAALIARSWFVLGLALTLSGLGGLALSAHGRDAPVIPCEPLHAPAFVLPFFALVGLRLSAAFPASLEANWIFRLTETPRSADYAAGVRSAALRTAVLPVLALLAIPYTLLWGPLLALAHLTLALAVALVTIEWMFLDFPKIPFTCTYLPGKANLRVTWPKHVAIGFVYCGFLPAAQPWVLARPAAWAGAMAALLLIRQGLVRLRERRTAASGSLVFDERAEPHVTQLGLDWRRASGGG